MVQAEVRGDPTYAGSYPPRRQLRRPRLAERRQHCRQRLLGNVANADVGLVSKHGHGQPAASFSVRR
jgi:hypothetical protein